MTLEEAIKEAEAVANGETCFKCAADHRQLASWLRELAERRKKEMPL